MRLTCRLGEQSVCTYVVCNSCQLSRVSALFSVRDGLDCIVGLCLRSNKRPKNRQNTFCSRDFLRSASLCSAFVFGTKV